MTTQTKRSIVYLDEQRYAALRLKAADTHRSVSEPVTNLRANATVDWAHRESTQPGYACW
jgi:hypothetical protein